MNILFASHTHLQSPFVVGSHHLARQLARQGHNVLHMATPVTPWHLLGHNRAEGWIRIKRAMKPGVLIESNLQELIPFSLEEKKNGER